MSIYDDDFRIEDDPSGTEKAKDPAFDFSLGNYVKNPGETTEATAGGHGGALPDMATGHQAFRIKENVTGMQPPSASAQAQKPPSLEPVKPLFQPQPIVPVAPVRTQAFKAPALPDPAVSPAAENDNAFLDKVGGFLNTLSGPAQMERMADTLNRNYATDYEHASKVAEPAHFLAKVRSLKNRQEMADTFSHLTRNLDHANAMSEWRHAQFDPTPINQYSEYEKRLARDRVSTALNRREEVTYDPEMAKKQAYPILDIVNHSYGYDSIGNTGFSSASFSMNDLKEQVRDHMIKGTALNYSHMEKTSRAMASLDNTGYGKAVRNFMASANIGSLNVGQEAVQTMALALSSLPPPEIAMFHYQQMYLANGNDSARWAEEVERMANYGRKMGDAAYGILNEGAGAMRGMRTNDYNSLKYFTLNPVESALTRPDKLAGDFFEKFLPSVASLYLPTKGANMAQLQAGGKLLTQLTWIAKNAYSRAGGDTLIKLQRHPHMVDNNPAFRKYVENSPFAQANPEKARQYFIEGEARKGGLQSAMMGVATATGSHFFRQATTTGAEGQILEYVQRFVMHECGNMAKEIVYAPHEDIIKDVTKPVERGI